MPVCKPESRLAGIYVQKNILVGEEGFVSTVMGMPLVHLGIFLALLSFLAHIHRVLHGAGRGKGENLRAGIVSEFVKYHNGDGPHQGIDGVLDDGLN